MIETFHYRPPLNYLFLGISIFVASAFCAAAIGTDPLWISILMGVLCLIFLVFGMFFLALFFRNSRKGKLRIGNDFIEAPERWKGQKHIKFSEIMSIGDVETYDHLIQIETRHGVYFIESKWMKKEDFNTVKSKLQAYWFSRRENDTFKLK